MTAKVKREVLEEDEGRERVVLKPMKCELDYLSRSDGSALVAQGNTVVLAAVNGPLEIKMQNQHIMKTTFEVLYCPKIGKPCVVDRYKENIIRQACELSVLKYLHPRTGITVTVQELEDFGGLMACVLNAVCLAFINAGLSMNYVFAAVSCVVDCTGNIVIDPTDKQSEANLATLTFVFDSRDKQLMIAFTDGTYSESAYSEALEMCRAASESVFTFYRDIVKKYSNTV